MSPCQSALVCLLALSGCVASAEDTATPDRAGQGWTDLVFSESAPYSTPSEVYKHSGYADNAAVYDVTKERFRVLPAPDTNSPPGLLIWISPGNDASIPRDWLEIFAQHRLIVVAPLKSGNDRHPIARMRMALDAVCNTCKRYKVDPKRIYVAGFSGGGRIASVLGVAYGDLFSGTICICGVNFYADVKTPTGEKYAGSFFPAAAPLSRAKTAGRFVLLSGELDMNRENTLSTYERGFKVAGFRNCHYLEVKGMKHELPRAAVLNTALAYLAGTAKESDAR